MAYGWLRACRHEVTVRDSLQVALPCGQCYAHEDDVKLYALDRMYMCNVK